LAASAAMPAMLLLQGGRARISNKGASLLPSILSVS